MQRAKGVEKGERPFFQERQLEAPSLSASSILVSMATGKESRDKRR